MRRIRTKALCAVLCCSLLLGGCGLNRDSADPSPSTPPSPSPVPTVSPSPSPAAENRRGGDTDKEETVYVKAGPDGRAREVKVETVLNYPGQNGTVTDRTRLTELKNTEGDEEFRLDANGNLYWEDRGEAIHYEGKSSDRLPVSVSISYTLDGKPISPEELAGKSGHLKLRFDYQNLTSETRMVSENGNAPVEVTTKIPFLAISMALLPDEVFSHVEVKNGRLLRFGEQNAFLGYAFPGLEEALTLRDNELTEDLEIPGYTELEADVRDFELDFTATIFSNGVLKDMEQDTLKDLYDFSGDMDALYDAASLLADGSGQFADGMGAYVSGVNNALFVAQELVADFPALQQEFANIALEVNGLQDALSGPPQQMEDAALTLRNLADWLGALKGMLEGIALAGGQASEEIQIALSTLEGIQVSADVYLPDVSLDSLNDELVNRQSDALTTVAAIRNGIQNMTLEIYDIPEDLEERSEQEQDYYAALQRVNAAHAAYNEQLSNMLAYLTTLEGQIGSMYISEDTLQYYRNFATDTATEIAQGVANNAAESVRQQLLPAAEALVQAKYMTDSIAGLNTENLDESAATLVSTAAYLGVAAETLRAAANSAVIVSFINRINALAEDMSGSLPGDVDYVAQLQQVIDGGIALNEAAGQLYLGNAAFRDGLAKMADLGGWRLRRLARELEAMRLADLDYENFGGIADGRSGSVRFIFETDAIEK